MSANDFAHLDGSGMWQGSDSETEAWAHALALDQETENASPRP